MLTISTILNICLIVACFIALKHLTRLRKIKNKFENLIPEEESLEKPSFLSIPTIRLQVLHPLFKTNEFGLPVSTEVYFIGKGDINVPGGTNDTESWILSVLAKEANMMFEFGTCTGKTAYLWAKNSKPDAKVYTLTLPPDKFNDYRPDDTDSARARELALKESTFTHFLYTGTPVQEKVVQLYGDSKQFDEAQFLDTFDLIFIDGSHAYSYIKNDTEKALRMLKPGGYILWHDYRGPTSETVDVYIFLNELFKSLTLNLITGTSLVVYKKN